MSTALDFANKLITRLNANDSAEDRIVGGLSILRGLNAMLDNNFVREESPEFGSLISGMSSGFQRDWYGWLKGVQKAQKDLLDVQNQALDIMRGDAQRMKRVIEMKMPKTAGETGMTSNHRIAGELLRMAKDILSMDFPTQDALDKYLKDHPDANRSNHKVVQHDQNKPETHPFNLMRQRQHEQKMDEIAKHYKKDPKDLTNDEIVKFNQRKK